MEADSDSKKAPSVWTPKSSLERALLTGALYTHDAVVTDDKPLRQTGKALSIPVSGSIGVLVRAVEVNDIEPGKATDRLLAIDEVGA